MAFNFGKTQMAHFTEEGPYSKGVVAAEVATPEAPWRIDLRFSLAL